MTKHVTHFEKLGREYRLCEGVIYISQFIENVTSQAKTDKSDAFYLHVHNAV
jgi:hypothetical protein